MLKNISQLTHKIGEKTYHMFADIDSPLNDVKEAILQFLKYVQGIEDAIKTQNEQRAQAAQQMNADVTPAPTVENVEPTP